MEQLKTCWEVWGVFSDQAKMVAHYVGSIDSEPISFEEACEKYAKPNQRGGIVFYPSELDAYRAIQNLYILDNLTPPPTVVLKLRELRGKDIDASLLNQTPISEKCNKWTIYRVTASGVQELDYESERRVSFRTACLTHFEDEPGYNQNELTIDGDPLFASEKEANEYMRTPRSKTWMIYRVCEKDQIIQTITHTSLKPLTFEESCSEFYLSIGKHLSKAKIMLGADGLAECLTVENDCLFWLPQHAQIRLDYLIHNAKTIDSSITREQIIRIKVPSNGMTPEQVMTAIRDFEQKHGIKEPVDLNQLTISHPYGDPPPGVSQAAHQQSFMGVNVKKVAMQEVDGAWSDVKAIKDPDGKSIILNAINEITEASKGIYNRIMSKGITVNKVETALMQLFPHTFSSGDILAVQAQIKIIVLGIKAIIDVVKTVTGKWRK